MSCQKKLQIIGEFFCNHASALLFALSALRSYFSPSLSTVWSSPSFFLSSTTTRTKTLTWPNPRENDQVSPTCVCMFDLFCMFNVYMFKVHALIWLANVKSVNFQTVFVCVCSHFYTISSLRVVTTGKNKVVRGNLTKSVQEGWKQGEETSWFYDVIYCLLLKTASLDHLHTVGQNLKNVGTRFE